MVPTKITRSARPSRKLDHKREGPFNIMEDPNHKTHSAVDRVCSEDA